MSHKLSITAHRFSMGENISIQITSKHAYSIWYGKKTKFISAKVVIGYPLISPQLLYTALKRNPITSLFAMLLRHEVSVIALYKKRRNY